MFALKRNQVIITALVVMIAVAGYLNYQDSRNINGTLRSEIPLNDQGEISALVPDFNSYTEAVDVYSDYTVLDGADIYTMAENPEIVTETEQTGASQQISEPGEAVFVNTLTASSYFVQAKLEREQSRAKQKEMLTEIINNGNIDNSKKAESADSIIELQKRIEKETAAEAMIEAKGFNEVYVRISDDSVDVVVNKSALTEAETAQIYDIVKRKTGINEEKIHISPLRK